MTPVLFTHPIFSEAHMDRTTILEKKCKAFERSYNAWARKRNLLSIGEAIVLKKSIVKREELDPAPRKPWPGLEIVNRALTTKDWRKILDLPWSKRQLKVITFLYKNRDEAFYPNEITSQTGVCMSSGSQVEGFNVIFREFSMPYRLTSVFRGGHDRLYRIHPVK